MTNVIIISTWSYNAADMRSDHWKRYLMDQGWVEGNETVFIFDEAQVTYDDGNLWNDFRDPTHHTSRKMTHLQNS